MRVLVLSSLSYSLLNFRGPLLASMIAEGHDVVACAPDDNPAVQARLEAMGARFVRTPMARAGESPFADLRTLASYIRLILKERPSLVLAYTQKPIIFGGIATRVVGGCRYFALMSGLGYVFSPAANDRPLLRRVVRYLYRSALKRAEAVFVFNEDDKSDMQKLGMISQRQRVVQVPGSGVDLSYFGAAPVPVGAPTFLMISRLMRDKGVIEYINAARIVRQSRPDARFMLLARPEHENPTAISPEELRHELAGSSVELLDETNDVRPHLAKCTTFVLPSYYREGLPRTILEAMAVGRPVITTDMPGCRDAVRDGTNGSIVPPCDVGALAKAMIGMAVFPEEAAQMGQQSRKMAEETYDVRYVNALLLQEMSLDSRQLSSEYRPRNAPVLASTGAV